jgi:hypothetical protein
MGNKRELYRIALDRGGEIRRGTEVSPCTILDLTEKGVQLTANLPAQAGETLQLEFSLTSHCTIHCTVLVTRVSGPQIGACITDISPEDQQHLSQFIEQLIAMNLGGV